MLFFPFCSIAKLTLSKAKKQEYVVCYIVKLVAFRKSLDANAILVMTLFSVFLVKLLTVCKEVVLELAIELGGFTLKIHIAKKSFSLCLSWHN